MAYYIIVAGGNLYSMSTAGVATQLTLPDSITIDQTRRPRMTVLGRNVVIVNAPTRSLFVTPDNVVRPLMLTTPSGPPVLAGGTSGLYSGTVQGKYTFIVSDPDSGALLCESDFSAASANANIVSQLIKGTGVAVSPDAATTARRQYRTTTGPGATFFPWLDLTGNGLTQFADDLSDAALQLVAAPTDLGMGPGGTMGTWMTLVASWKNRLWGVGDVAIDTLRFTGDSKIYGWPATFGISIAPIGADQFGVTGLLPRRDELGVSKRNVLWKVIGTGAGSAPLFDFSVIKVKEGAGAGVWGPDTVVIINDDAYYLGEFGVNRWSADGVTSMVNGKVRKWFATDTYFNRSQFPNAIGKYNARYHSYELHLASAGQTTLDRWVSLDLASGAWYGPHKTDAFTPTHGRAIVDVNGYEIPIMGSSSGFVYLQNQSNFLDDATAIAIDWESKYHDGQTPGIEKLFGSIALVSKGWPAFGSITLRARAGSLDNSGAFTVKRQNTMTPDMRMDEQVLDSVGQGRFAQIGITGSSQSGQGCEVYGYEIPFHELGRRR